MYSLRTLHVRLNPSSLISLSTLSLRTFSRQRRGYLLARSGAQTLAWHGQKLWLHSSPVPDPSQERKSSHSPGPQNVEPPEKRDSLSTTDHPSASPAVEEGDPLQDKSMGLFQRFKKTFQQYGKVMVTVHVLTSSAWIGAFYYAAMKGVNVVPFLEFIGLPESIVGILKNSESGNVLTAYALYKIATPIRYTVTLGGTSISVKYLRKYGYLSTPPLVKEYIQDKMEETKERLSEKMEETRGIINEKMEETKERLSEKMEETRGIINEKMEETKDKISEKLQETKDSLSFRKKSDGQH